MKPAAAAFMAGILIAGHAVAATPYDRLLTGNYAVTGTFARLYAPNGGFNASLVPVDQSTANAIWATASGVRYFDGHGIVTVDNATISNNGPADHNSLDTPGINANTENVMQTYAVTTPTGEVAVTFQNDNGTVTAGTRLGQIFTIDLFSLTGYLSSDRRALTLTTVTPKVETITFSNGDIIPRICHRSFSLIKIG
jgi:hypothetical protein